MRVIRDANEANSLPPDLQALVHQRIALLSEDEPYDPAVHGYFIVVDEGDELPALDKQLGFPILSNRFDGCMFGEEGFTPCHEVLEEHASYYEMVFVLSDDGYGVEVFIPKSPAIDPRLTAMCQHYVIKAQEHTPR